MFARRRQTKKLLQIARLMRELDAVAPQAAKRQRRARVSLRATV
jgi:hypothetical protein